MLRLALNSTTRVRTDWLFLEYTKFNSFIFSFLFKCTNPFILNCSIELQWYVAFWSCFSRMQIARWMRIKWHLQHIEHNYANNSINIYSITDIDWEHCYINSYQYYCIDRFSMPTYRRILPSTRYFYFFFSNYKSRWIITDPSNTGVTTCIKFYYSCQGGLAFPQVYKIRSF